MRAAVPLAVLAGVLAVGGALGVHAREALGAGGPARAPRTHDAQPRALVVAAAGGRATSNAPWAVALRPLLVRNRSSGAHGEVRLYADDGRLDDDAVRAFVRVAASPGANDVSEPLPPRLVQLVGRAAYHFGGKPVLVVSATRKGAHGKHGTGEAIDFAVDGVKAAVLAAWLRQSARAGVGVYTHPRTQYVHLDVRDVSFHWLDGSPPGVTWRERRLPDPKQVKRDAAWTELSDLPESAL